MRRPSDNGLLSLLPPASLAFLQPHLERIEMRAGFACVTAGEPIEWVYFPTSGLVSLRGDGRLDAHIGLYGRDAFSGCCIALGIDRTPFNDVVCLAGEAERVSTKDLCQTMAADPCLKTLLIRCVHVMNVQMSSTLQSLATGALVQRLSRLILMIHDRTDGDIFPCTHDSLSTLLGARRSSITSTMHLLEGEHLVRASRGALQIRDRFGLGALAGDCYGVAEAEYERLLQR